MHRCDEPEQTAAGAVPEQVTADLDGVADLDVLSLDASQEDRLWIGGLEGPYRRLAFGVFHVEVDDRMWHDEDHLFDRPLHHGPLRHVVVTVRMMGEHWHGQARRTDGGNADRFAVHGHPPHRGGRTIPSIDVLRSRSV